MTVHELAVLSMTKWVAVHGLPDTRSFDASWLAEMVTVGKVDEHGTPCWQQQVIQQCHRGSSTVSCTISAISIMSYY